MHDPSEIESLYIDFDAFFANVERQLHPEIRNHPVGVTALDSDYAAFITRCYLAKGRGIKRGMRVRDARAICPDIIVRVAQPDVYVDVHNRILDEIDRHIPVTKVWSIDEMECTLTGSERDRAREIAEAIRDGLAKNIGPFITPSIGLAPNQFLAKVAAEMNKPCGLTVMPRSALPGPLLHLSLRDLPGISGSMEKRLRRAGITSVADFWDISAKHTRAIWGSIEGERMWAQLHGHLVIRPPTEKRMFGHSRVLTKGWNTPERALKCLELLTVKAAYRLRRAGYLCGAMSVSFKLKSGEHLGGQTDFAYCRDDPALLAHMHGLFKRGTVGLPRGARLKSVNVMLHNITQPSQASGDLFEHADAGAGKSAKWNTVMDTMDGLNLRHGRAVIHVGSRSELPGGYAGGKIAFGRVPDKEDFF